MGKRHTVYASFLADRDVYIQSSRPYLAVTIGEGHNNISWTEHTTLSGALRRKGATVYQWNPFKGRSCWHVVPRKD